MLREKVLEQLKRTNEHISGQELGSILSVSRTAVWKAISSLKKEGYDIEAVNNKGYKLLEVKDILNEAELRDRLGKNIHIKYSREIDSTNSWAKRLYESDEIKKDIERGDYVLLTADSQTEGKGRRGRYWHSKASEGIWMSIVFKKDIRVDRVSMLTLVAAMAVNRAIESVCGLKTLIKWPNDIVYDKKKLCGILTELGADIDGIKYIICGIGLNTNSDGFEKELENIATSIKLTTGKDVLRVALISKIVESFISLCRIFMETADFSKLKSTYEELLINKEKTVKIQDGDREYEAVALGINDMGELVVKRLDDNTIHNIFSGEVSVRGIYGYV